LTSDRLRFAPATSLSLEAYAEAYTEGFEGYHRALRPDAAKMARLGRVYNYDFQHSLIAYDGDTVAGMAVLAIRGEAGWCGGFGVAPAFRRRGVGRQLMTAMLDSARAAGLRRLSLEVSALNPVARRLYEWAGLRITRDLLIIERDAAHGPESSELEGGVLEDAASAELLPHFARLHLVAPAWQRDLPTMLVGLSHGLRLGPRESPRAYALVSEGTDGETQVADLAAADEEAARELTAALARRVAGRLRVLNEPEQSLFVAPLLENGFAETERQHQMAIEL
jgi:ribosomal protein S18 acetylase RimI-like enzyme